MGRKRETIWSKYFIILCLAVILTGISQQMLNSNLAPFADAMWKSRSLGGYLTTAFNAGSIITAFFCGWLVDRKGRRRCFIAGCLLYGIPTFLCAIWPTPAVTLSVRFMQGVGKGVTSVASASIVADVVAYNRMGEGMGLFGLGNVLAMALGPAIALSITSNGKYGAMFVVCGVLYCATAILVCGIDYEKKAGYIHTIAEQRNAGQKNRGKDSESDPNYKGIWKLIEKGAVLPSISNTIFFFSYACILVFITVYSQEILHLTVAKISFFYICAAIAMLIGRLFSGNLFDKLGALSVIIPGHCCIVISLLFLAFLHPQNYIIFLACGYLYGLGSSVVMPVFNAIAVVDSPDKRRGIANATFYFMQDFGILFSSAIFGRVIDDAPTLETGYTRTFTVSAVVCMLSLICSILLYNNKTRNKRRVKSCLETI